MIRNYPLCLPSAGPYFLGDGENLGDYTEVTREKSPGPDGHDVDGNEWKGYRAIEAKEIGPGAASRGGMDGRDTGSGRPDNRSFRGADRDATGYT